ncbi:cytochrome P450 3A9-like [Elgaria multicarinata webbii]|uniref:cytochrome P450 3A9-like n=1 Tax=Elgaria multicarinata webbii TaxID=159646 RepID=UPI002FCD3C43
MDFLPFFSFETWALLITSIGLLLLYGVWPYGVFQKLGIPGPKPLPFFGSTLSYRKGVSTFDESCYKKYGKMWGFYDGRQPVLAITDPAIIKTVLVKECYSVFTNRRSFGPTGKLRTAVSLAEDETWKRIRMILSPTFTSGKLKETLPIIQHHVESLIKHVGQKVEKGELLDIKEILGAYSMDVVTSSSFGVNTDSMNNPKDPFVKEGKKLVKFNLFSPLFILLFAFPWLTPVLNMMNVSLFSSEAVEFFARSIKKIKEKREKVQETGRMDFLRMMIESQKAAINQDGNGVNKALTDEEIMAQAVIFIFAGYEATSNLLGYLLYELAINPDVQQKLQDEVDAVLPNKAQYTYDSLMQLEYLDMALSEVLRMYPVGGRIERVCKKTVEINGVLIPKGTVVMIPPTIMHYEAEYWDEPKEFRPERFSKENKDSISPYVYMPFGTGPRNCIGMRFALLTMKAAAARLMQNFTFRPCKETQIPLVLNTLGLLTPEKPIILKAIRRDSSTH